MNDLSIEIDRTSNRMYGDKTDEDDEANLKGKMN